MTYNIKPLTAIFDRYEFGSFPRKLWFKRITDEEGRIVRNEFWISDISSMNVIGRLIVGEIVEFSAEVVGSEMIIHSKLRRFRDDKQT